MNSLSPLRILIVEDEAIIAMDIEDSVEEAGHVSVGWVTTAREAMAALQATTADLVLLDVRLMDGSSGFDVAAHLNSAAGPPFVFLTANAEELPDDLAGAMGVLSKPFTMDRLIATLGYFQEGLFDPPPTLKCPYGLRLSPDVLLNWR